jgi:hypothetical protein
MFLGEAMTRMATACFVLCAAGVCAAQTPAATPSIKHFRLTFVLTYPQGQQSAQSIVLDVPVAPDHPGTSGMTSAAGITGQVDGSVQQSLQCTDVHESETGLAAAVTFAMDSVAKDPPPYSAEPLHHNLSFDRKIDLVLGKPTRITGDMQIEPLRKGDEAIPNRLAAPPQITVTAVEM